ncbi:hypothetical protein E3_0340 [Rhodococcus phage E3]|uniref:hypothetical protein n=1 Tax=Rhodococcus phage E3 TaxID=1007869 RepID=UPI0002C6CB71|nr:hypothetical protein M176_gp035 [Rhodococcus phage E3]AEQ20945.1 hypothetical protein E3_0340 [Rhodococcus phage E3]
MGYGIYERGDTGKTAGYYVEDDCDVVGCKTVIRLGLDALCGTLRMDERGAVLDERDPGCGKYVCSKHEDQHDCARPKCATYSPDESLQCGLLKGHEPPCVDRDTDETFTSLSVARGGEEPPTPVEVIAEFIANAASITIEQAMPQARELDNRLDEYGYGFSGKGRWP